MKQKKTTIHEIAKALNTTASTVSRALNNHPRISDKTKKSVLDMAKKLEYEPNSMAASLRMGKSKIVGIIVPYADQVFFSSVIRGIEEEVKKSGFNVIICQSYEKLANEIKDVNALLSAQVAGIIISISKESNKFNHLQRVIDKKKPLILFDRSTDELDSCSVVIDDFQGAYLAVKHLLENGYHRIAFFSENRKVSIFRERFRGYQTAIIEHGINPDEKLILEIASQPAEGRAAIEKLMKSTNPPDALFSASDFSALGALIWLKENGFNVPGEFGIAGFSNEPFTQYIEPSMTTVDQKSRLMGQMSAQAFLDQLNNDGNPTQRKILLKPELIIRESSFRQ